MAPRLMKFKKTNVFLFVILCIGITWFVVTPKSKYTNNSRNIHLWKYKRPISTVTNANTAILNDRHETIKKTKSAHTDLSTVTMATLSVPKVIYMLWDKGWVKAPPLQRLCLKSVQLHNPEFAIKAMNLTEAEKLISRERYYTDNAWKRATIQSKSDIIRVELLTRYGGIWADATVHCNEPLLNWLNDSLLPTEFFAYERRDSDVTNETYPWISSWFLVATTTSKIMRMWRDRVRQAWTEEPLPREKLGYFWVHRLFRELVISNTTFRTLFHQTPFLNARLPHCLGSKDVVPHMYKLPACREVSKNLLETEYNII